MASNVNMKFAAILAAAVMVVVVGVVGVAALTLRNTGDEYIARGDAAVAAGDLELAAEHYSRAVNKDRTRIDWLEKWRGTLIQLTPETQVAYERSYNRHYLGILEQMAVIEYNVPARQRELLEEKYEQAITLFPTALQFWQNFTALVKQRVDPLDQSSAEARSLWRFRGLAILAQMMLTDIDEVTSQQGLTDLRAAIEADPTDFEVARGIVLWHTIKWRRAHLDRRTIDARRLDAELTQALDDFSAGFPDHFDSTLTALEVKIEQLSVREANDAAERAMIRDLVGEETTIVAAFRQANTDDITPNHLARLDVALRRLDAPERHEQMLEIIQRSAAADPNNPRLITLQSGTLGTLGRFDEAIALIQNYLELPREPISLAGMVQRYYRPQALQKLAEQALAKWEQDETEEDKAASITIARDALTELSTSTAGGEQSQEALTVQGKLAQAEDRHAEAVRIFTELVEKRGQADSDTRWRLADSLRSANQLGAAKQQLHIMLENDPLNLRALLTLAEIHARLKEADQARAVMASIQELYPNVSGLDQANDRLERILEGDPERDSIRMLIAQSQSIRSANTSESLTRARNLIRPALDENPGNIPLTIEMVDIEVLRGQSAEARRVIIEALTHHPNNPTLERLERSMSFDDPYVGSVAIINDSEFSDAEKLVRLYLLARQYSKADDAARIISEMDASHRNDPAVIEVLFSNALNDQDYSKAREYVAIAAEINADQANGLIFQGRLEIVEGQFETAVRSLRQASEILPYNSKLLMLLGQTELNLGLVGESLRTLERAYSAKPDDAGVARSYAQILMELQRWNDALDVSRAAIKLNPHDRGLWAIWLVLEERAGDIAVALSEREDAYQQDNADLENALALAGLYSRAGRLDDAGRLITQIESSTGPSIDTVLLQSRIFAAQGDVQAGQRLVQQFLADNPDASSDAQPIIALADFLIEYGLDDDAIRLLEESRESQSAELMEIDRRLGDYYFGAGRLEDSLVSYYAIMNAGADNDNRVALRCAETLTSLERLDEADQTLDRMGEAANTDMTAVLIRARIAVARGDARAARGHFDRAVELKPNDPMPFIQRAQFNAQDDGQFNDALADVDQAIRLQPDLVVARRLKAEMLAGKGRETEAVAELRRAVDADPSNDDLRSLLVQYLVRINDYVSAISFAERTVGEREGDMYWVRVSGDLSARAAELATLPERSAEFWEKAAGWYHTLYEADPNDAAGLRVANALLLQRDPDPAEALRIVEAMTQETRDRGDIQSLYARTLYQVGREDDAIEQSTQSFAKVTTGLQMRIWYDQNTQMFGSTLDTGRFAATLTPPAELTSIYELLQVIHLFQDLSLQSSLLSRLAAVESDLTETRDRIDVLRYRGRIQFQLEQYADSAATFAEAVEIAPNDLEFNNNLAYLRSEYLDDFEGAIQPAEQAAAIAPQDANVLDTLGWTYYRANQLSKAQQALQTARQYATGPMTFIPIEIHLGYVFAAKQDLVQANRLYQSARERLLDAPGLADLYQEDLDSLRALLDQAE